MTGHRWESLYAEETRRDETITLIKPLCFMNESGRPVKAWLEGTSVPPERLVVIHDDLDLAFGRIKVVAEGGHGGHRGVRFIQEAIETVGFPRVRVGIGRPEVGDEVTFVLNPFDAAETHLLPDLIGRAADTVEEIIERGVVSAMNRFNVWRRAEARGEPAESTRGEHVESTAEEVDGCQSTK
jgi:PTH1 family peptidyl-tRNA hydrolase